MFVYKWLLFFANFVFYSYGKSQPNWTSWSQENSYQISELECSEGKGIHCERRGQAYRILNPCNEFCDGYNQTLWKNTQVRIEQYSQIPLSILYLVLVCTH